MRVATCLVILLIGCSSDAREPAQVGGEWENLAPVPNPNDEIPPQPMRDNPYAVAMTANGQTALVTLRGSELEPGDAVALLDVRGRSVRARLTVGARPHAVAIWPGGDLAVVLSQLSPHAAIVDIGSAAITGKIRVGYYAADLSFDAAGETLYVTNRASDEIQRWEVGRVASRLEATLTASAPAGVNPNAVVVSPDQRKVYVADVGGLRVRVYDAGDLTPLAEIPLDAPVADLAVLAGWITATTLNDTSGLPCEEDGDYIGTQGDGIFGAVTDRTCSRGFADIQNEIAFIDPARDEIAIRYTSDTAEISEADREGDHLPELMRVRGALPNRIAVTGEGTAVVTMSASMELVELVIDGGAPPSVTMPRSFPVGFAPEGVAADAAGTVAVVANRLGETVSIIDLGSGAVATVEVGVTSPAFPATTAELGELYFFSALYATDGDQSCSHCHPDAENDGKGWGVDVVLSFGRRSTMIMRNLFETRPHLIEGVFDENDFSLEMEGISFRPDFHDSSYALQVQRRDEFYREVSRELLGYEVGFDRMVEAIAAFLVVEPRLLPSPFPDDTAQVERGEALFARPDVGCAACHPPPTFASPELFQGVTTLGRYDLPRRDLDPDISIKYIENARDGFFNSNSLRGLWDRRGSLFHDGRARTIRETLLTPGHPCLRRGERPFNEFEGQVDTNGGISHLTCEQIDDLVAFLQTID